MSSFRDPQALIPAQAGLGEVVARAQAHDPLWVVDDQDHILGQIRAQSLLKWVGRSLPEELCAQDVMDLHTANSPLDLGQGQAFVELVNHGIPGYVQRLIWDLETQSLSLAYISAGVELILGLSREELGTDLAPIMNRFIHPQDRNQVRQELHHLIENGGVSQGVFRIVTPDHQVRWLQRYCQTHPLAENRLAIDSLLIDITNHYHKGLLNAAIIQAIPDLLVHLDREGRCLQIFNCDSARLREQGFPLGYRKADVLPPDLAALWTKAIRACLATGEMQTFEQCLTILGQQQQESVRIVPLEANSVLAVIRDCSECKRVELAFQESEARFQLLAENATDMITTKTPAGVYTYVSPACQRLLGYTPAEMVGVSAYSFLLPEEIPVLQAHHQELLTTGVARVIHRIRCRNQNALWVESSVRLIRDPQTNTPLEIQSVVRDISERIAYEQDLRIANESLRYEVDVRNAQLRQDLMYANLLNTISDQIRNHLDAAAIVQTTVTLLGETLSLYRCQVGVFEPTALTFTAEYEWSAQSEVSTVVGIPCRINPAMIPQFSQCTGLHYSTEHSLFGKSTLLTCAIRDPGQPHRLLKLFRPAGQTFTTAEITLAEQVAQQCMVGIRQAYLFQSSQNQIQKLRELNESKDDFLHMVSHELRTPLTNMKMALTMLQTIRDPQRQEQYFSILHKAWQQELNLVNELLELQALESGSLQPNISAFIPTTMA